MKDLSIYAWAVITAGRYNGTPQVLVDVYAYRDEAEDALDEARAEDEEHTKAARWKKRLVCLVVADEDQAALAEVKAQVSELSK